ncbi:MAG: 50S ribosomal protein L32 [Chloroflexi bacterium]|nr:50S ribosomal protein L32 [Chloroflexota bacterium]MBU1661511.1 50S ribosomal protein L32 [Chloroflexota bacterium]
MPPLPKQRMSRTRRDRRRTHHALKTKSLVQCSHCGEMRLPHRVCPKCGYYKGREVVVTEE